MRRLIPLALLFLTGCADSDEFADTKDKVRFLLKDPASAEFRNIKAYPGVTCGEVNARNGFGGMVGFKPFIIRAGVADYVEGDDLASFVQQTKILTDCLDQDTIELNKRLKSG